MPKSLEQQLQEIEEEEKRLAKVYEDIKNENKCYFLEPLPYQQELINLLEKKRLCVMVAGNRTGKTTIAVNLIAAYCLGFYPWVGEDAKTPFNPPIRVRIVAPDWEKSVGQVIVPKLKEWLPRGHYDTKRNHVGIESHFFFRNKSSIEILTHGVDPQAVEGWSGHFVFVDEAMPKVMFSPLWRGLVDFQGKMLITMTALSSVWLYKEIIKSRDPEIQNNLGYMEGISTYENKYLSSDAIKAFEATCTQEEKQARILGKWLELAGLVLKNFKPTLFPDDPAGNIINAFPIPSDWIVFCLIDLHLSRPQAISFFALSPQEGLYIIDEVLEHLSPEEVADVIVRKKVQNGWARFSRAWIDPLAKGDMNFIKNRGFAAEDSFTIISNKLRPHGIALDVASKDKASGIRNLNSRLKGVNKMPSLWVFDSCVKHIDEFSSWIYDDEEKPSKEYPDHFCENSYRATLVPLKYQAQSDFKRPLKIRPRNVV